MSGHNKWSSIKHRKGKADAQRGRAFTKITRELITAAKIGGGDPEGNSRLRQAINAARAVNMPNDNITRAIKKGTGELEGVSYEELLYEGYGPSGVAVLVQGRADADRFEDLKRGLEEKGVKSNTAEVAMLPQSTIHLEGKAADQMLRLMNALEEADDVQNVWANFDISDEAMEAFGGGWGRGALL